MKSMQVDRDFVSIFASIFRFLRNWNVFDYVNEIVSSVKESIAFRKT